MGLHVHHIITKGCGGPDHRYNLITLCAECHTRTHAGRISQDCLWRIVGRREGVEASTVETTIRMFKQKAHVGMANQTVFERLKGAGQQK
ncbi:MAG TPA: HNH endonuclease [Tepidimicrobium sp.]|nr:HNH endonuclease [Tepidimicrobium sp.]